MDTNTAKAKLDEVIINNSVTVQHQTAAVNGPSRAALGASRGAADDSTNPNTFFPAPNSPTGGGPDYSIVNPNCESSYDATTGYLDLLNAGIQYVDTNGYNDPGAILRFIGYVGWLEKNGLMNSDVQAALYNADGTTLISFGIDQAMENAFYFGYGSPSVNGKTGANAFLTALLAQIPAGSDPYLNQMRNEIGLDQAALGADGGPDGIFTTEHTAQATITLPDGKVITKGDLIWQFGDVTYDWNWTQGTGANAVNPDQYFIQQIISNQGVNGDPSNYFDNLNMQSFERDWRLRSLLQLLEEFKDPVLAIMIWISLAYDKQAQSSFKGYSGTNDLLTTGTNDFATPLLQAAKLFGSMTTDNGNAQALNFLNLFENSTNFTNTEYPLSSISSQWSTNVYNAVMTMPVNLSPTGAPISPTNPSVPLGNIIQSLEGTPGYTGTPYTLPQLTLALNNLNIAPPSTPDPSAGYAVNPQYQSMLTALQSGGGYFTGTSKNIETEMSTTTNLDTAVTKLGDSVVSTTGGGIMQMIAKIVSNMSPAASS